MQNVDPKIYGFMTHRWRWLLVVGICWVGCVREYVGRPCQIPDQKAPKPIGDASDSTVEIYEQIYQSIELYGDEEGKCESMICIAAAGRSGYCSKKCRDVTDCPIGFVCQMIYPFKLNNDAINSEQTYCVWKSCHTPADCGPLEQFDCTEKPFSHPDKESNQTKRCSYR